MSNNHLCGKSGIYMICWRCFLFGIALCALAISHDGYSQGNPTVTVRGQVVKAGDPGENYALAEANVLLKHAESQLPVGSGITDRRGMYYIPNVVPGRYILEIYYIKVLIQQNKIEIPSDPSAFRRIPGDPSTLLFDVAAIEVRLF
jgi:hypothetical protein